MKCQKCGTDYYVDDLTASPFCEPCRKEYQEAKNKTLETISIEHLQDWQSNAFDEHIKVCTEQRNAILDCWELVDFKNQYPNDGIAHHTYQDIANNQADLIKKIRDILDPVVQKIYKEGDSDEKIDFNLDPTPQLRKVTFRNGDCPVQSCQSFDTTYLGTYKGYDCWKCNSCGATFKTKRKED